MTASSSLFAPPVLSPDARRRLLRELADRYAAELLYGDYRPITEGLPALLLPGSIVSAKWGHYEAVGIFLAFAEARAADRDDTEELLDLLVDGAQ